MPTTSKWALRYPAGTDSPDIPLHIQNLATDLDGVAMDGQGLLSARPAATTSGRYYYATDDTTTGPTGTLFRDNGTAWERVGNQSVPQVRVTHSTTQATNTTESTAAWDTETYDLGTPSNNMHDTASNNSRLTCRVAGLHRITLDISSGSGIAFTAAIRLNGSGNIAFTSGKAVDYGTELIATADYRLSVGDYVEARLRSFGASTIVAASFFQMHWVSP